MNIVIFIILGFICVISCIYFRYKLLKDFVNFFEDYVNNEQHIDGVAHISTSPIPYYRIIDVMDCDSTNPTIWAELKEVK